MDRRAFISKSLLGGCAVGLGAPLWGNRLAEQGQLHNHESRFGKRLTPIGRVLEEEGYYVWCNSPIYGPDGQVHLFYSRWPQQYGMGGWIHQCEIARAVAPTAYGPFVYKETVLASRGGFFDATTCHNPTIHFVDGVYYLFYMGNSNGKTNTKRIGLATSNSLEGPWARLDAPLLEAGAPGEWDDHCTTNPAFVRHPDGRYLLYYKSWNTAEYENAPKGAAIKGNRKYGVAVADRPQGPYVKYMGNPVIDFSGKGQNRQLEDAYVWHQHGCFNLVARDMGFFDHSVGLLFQSKDGLGWQSPQIAYHPLERYVNEPPAPPHLKRYGRLERPQLLLKNGKPEYLFGAAQGGTYLTSTVFAFRIGR